MKKVHENSLYRHDLRSLGSILFVATFSLAIALYILVIRSLTDTEWQHIQFPTTLQRAQELGQALESYATKQPTHLLFAHMCCYLYLQTFGIPGTIFFNLLGGALFGITWGFPLCLLYNTIGSITMYLLSKTYGKRMVQYYFPDKLHQLKEMIDGHRDDLSLYMIFIRIFPFTPNWFINIASPHVDIPLFQFMMGPAIGLIPYNFLSCKAGLILKELRSKGDIIDTNTTIQLVFIAVFGALLLPRLKQRFNTKPLERKSQ